MFEAARRQMRTIAMIGVAAALVVGGVAAAQGESNVDRQKSAKRPPGPPPAMGVAMKDLTYAELHVRNQDGESEIIRLDQGKVKSITSDSITVVENDGNEVTIPVDAQTKVLGKPGEKTTLADLEEGQQVSVSAPEGEPAEVIMVLPKKGELVGGFHGGPMPPPPGDLQLELGRSAQ